MNSKLKLWVGFMVLCAWSANAKLIAHWSFDGYLGNSVSTDYPGIWSGEGNPTYSLDAKYGQSLLFDNPDSSAGGSATDRMYIGGPADWAGSSNWTFSAWVKLLNDDGTRSIFSSNGSANGFYTLYGQFRENSYKFNVYYHDDADDGGEVNLTIWQQSTNEWYRMTVVFDADNGIVTSYSDTMDGIGGLTVLGSATNYATPMTLSSSAFQIGHTATRFGFNGYIDDVRIYDTALSETEVDELDEILPPPLGEATIADISAISSNVVEIAINNPDQGKFYTLKGKTDLVIGATWTNWPHSDDGVNPFVVTNLDYSGHDGTNKLIYVQATNAAVFFRVDAEY